LIELIREEVRRLEKDNWTIHFTWVKAHNDNIGNEMAARLARRQPEEETEKLLPATYRKVQ
jgi:ribonuclease HI